MFLLVALWNNFCLPLVMSQDQQLFPVTFGLFTRQSRISGLPELHTLVVVGAVVAVVPLVIMFSALRRSRSSALPGRRRDVSRGRAAGPGAGGRRR